MIVSQNSLDVFPCGRDPIFRHVSYNAQYQVQCRDHRGEKNVPKRKETRKFNKRKTNQRRIMKEPIQEEKTGKEEEEGQNESQFLFCMCNG